MKFIKKIFIDGIIYNIKNIKKILFLISKYKMTVLLLFFIIIFSAVFEIFSYTLIIPFLSIIINDNLNVKFGEFIVLIKKYLPLENILFLIMLLFVILQLLKAVIFIFQNYMQYRLMNKLRIFWGNTIFDKYFNGTFLFYINQKQGEIIHNIVGEPNSASKAILSIVEIVVSLIFSFFMIFSLLYIDWRITISAFSVCLVVYFLISIITKKYLINLGKKKIQYAQNLTRLISESIIGFVIVKIYLIFKKRAEEYNKIIKKYSSTILQNGVITNSFIPIIEIIMIVYFSIFIFIMTKFKIDAFKAIFPTISVILIISQKLFSRFGKLASLIGNVNFFKPSLSLIYDLLTESIEQEDIKKGKSFDSLKTDITFSNLSFSFKKQKVLNNVNITIPRGKMTAFVGPSGIGKSTIANIIIRFLKPASGEIKVNNMNLNEYSIESWRSKIGYVTQDTILFNATIKENILIGKSDATDEDIISAAKKAAIHDFILSLPEKYDTVVGDRGMKLSGGQKQRIAIARAIIRDPEIYIFDEATSSLDNESEKIIQKSIENLGKMRTVIVIAHRLTTIENADIVYDLGKMK